MKTDHRTSEITSTRRRWLRWLTYLGIVLLPGLIVFVSRQGWRPSETKKKLQETLAVLDRTEPGWRLADIEAAREPIPEEANSARVVAAALKLLPKNWPAVEFRDSFDRLPPEKQLAAEDFARLKKELDKVRSALQEAHKLIAMPRGRHRIEYRPFVWDIQLFDQWETWRIVHLLCYDALRHDRERDLISALNSCRAAFHAARSLGDEPDATQMIRMGGVIKSCRSIERVLAQGEPPPEQLADLQDLLRREDNFPDQLVVALGMRAVLHSGLDALGSDVVPLSRLQSMFPPKINPFLEALPSREELRHSHPTMLEVMCRYVAIARLPLHKQPVALKQLDQDLRSLKQSDPLAFDFTLPFAKTLADTFEECHDKHAYLRCLDVALATECYRREHKQWPQTLDKLGPHFLSVVHVDPFDGKPLRYRRVADGVFIYSVGSDRVDDNGKLDREHPNQTGVDIGIRLWDAAKRRQSPRPKPPNEEESR